MKDAIFMNDKDGSACPKNLENRPNFRRICCELKGKYFLFEKFEYRGAFDLKKKGRNGKIEV